MTHTPTHWPLLPGHSNNPLHGASLSTNPFWHPESGAVSLHIYGCSVPALQACAGLKPSPFHALHTNQGIQGATGLCQQSPRLGWMWHTVLVSALCTLVASSAAIAPRRLPPLLVPAPLRPLHASHQAGALFSLSCPFRLCTCSLKTFCQMLDTELLPAWCHFTLLQPRPRTLRLLHRLSCCLSEGNEWKSQNTPQE